MVCIGPGPGPKNVLAEDTNGYQVVVPYAIWKHKMKNDAGERLSDMRAASGLGPVAISPDGWVYPLRKEPMSTTDKVYLFKTGQVQAFVKDGVKQPAVKVGSHNGDTVYNITIQTDKQNYIDVAFWGADFGDAPSRIVEGCFVAVKGSYVANQPTPGGKVFHKINAFQATVQMPLAKLERQPVNQQAATVTPAVPAEQNVAAPAAAAPAAAPADTYDF